MPRLNDAEIEEAYAAGDAAWRNGSGMPPYPGDEVTHESLFWVGFVAARARDFFRRRSMALYPDTVEPRPPSSAIS